MSLESRWATWTWRWSTVQLAIGAVVLVAAFVPAARVDGPAVWVVLGLVLAIAGTGLVLSLGAFFGGLATTPTGPVSDTEWNRLPAATRRRLARAVRRVGAVDPEHRDLARWHAERSIRAGLPQAALQGCLGVMWLGNSLLDTVGEGVWWFHVGFGALLTGFVLVMLWVLVRTRRSLSRLEGELIAPAG